MRKTSPTGFVSRNAGDEIVATAYPLVAGVAERTLGR